MSGGFEGRILWHPLDESGSYACAYNSVEALEVLGFYVCAVFVSPSFESERERLDCVISHPQLGALCCGVIFQTKPKDSLYLGNFDFLLYPLPPPSSLQQDENINICFGLPRYDTMSMEFVFNLGD